jgi:hypothetical protein
MSNVRTANHLPHHATPADRPHTRLRVSLCALLALVLIGWVAVALSGDFLARVWQERELIAAGKRIREALGAYYQSSPGTAKTYPSALQHLLMDPRILGEIKYLDYLPTDPLTRKNEWVPIKNASGEVIGVHSLAVGTPSWLGQLFAPSGSGSNSYAEWKFVHQP